MVVWRSGRAMVSINEVNLRRARLVCAWVTVSGFNSRCRTLCQYVNTKQPPRPTQRSILLGSVNKDQLRLGRKWQVWFLLLADERGVCRINFEIPWERVPYLSALEVCSRRGAIKFQVYVYLYLTIIAQTGTRKGMSSLETNFGLCTLFLLF